MAAPAAGARWLGAGPAVPRGWRPAGARLLLGAAGGAGVGGGDEVGDALGLVDLDVVPGVVERVQLAVGEQPGEVAGDPGVEVAVAGAEDHLDGAGEAAQVADAPPVADRRGEQVVVEAPERRAGGQGLLIQLRD